MTVGQALTTFLDNQYINFDGKEYKFVEGVFAIFGHGNVVGFGEALAHMKHNLKFIIGRNEQNMAHAATAFARQNRRLKIYACTSSVGPGALNMVTAAGTATANRIPLLLLPGDTFACRQPDPVLQQIEQENSKLITANDSFKAVCKYFDRVNRPEQLMTAMINAMRVLTNPAETGAVAIALPQDVQGEIYEFPKSFLEKRIHYISRQMPNHNDIKRAAEIIKKYKKPKITVIISDPFFPKDYDNDRTKLRNAIHDFMVDTINKYGSYEYIKYQKIDINQKEDNEKEAVDN